MTMVNAALLRLSALARSAGSGAREGYLDYAAVLGNLGPAERRRRTGWQK